uniref:ribosomal protein L16 n=1 Tax=Phytophthora tropicalis TaxID=137729 RepID=UPI0020296A1B|nr:ribosomal protein L16 [Phytophthora tropicalis]YP_010394607.1 ribosomal protein L16 [Phytophthora capsici]DAZ89005.1 TPA_asm: ribosomal protein L16 [Phytophthora sp. SKS-2017]UXG56492.1 ribosomal protein L16 [Phytophthora capsici]DAZ88182.1 TPA_asm: ribosomal protein L16 [Phytophthora tropicalis]DAZ88654.1 TPA_asm: ribosomal protein L16 [Phytophthora capsici]DAZ88693.1 TPA_asm: ribosomal protein L16 [Phytophthora capsici]
MLFPKKTKYKKQFKGKLVGKTTKSNNIVYGKYAIKVLEETRLTSRQIEATRRIIIRKMKRLGFLWIRVFPDTPVTAKPTENRMGKGKGAVSFWVAKVKKGQILYEISGISLENAKKVLKAGSNKLPIKTKFIYK